MRTVLAATFVVGAVALTGCAQAGSASTDDATPAAAGEGVTAYPLTLENCGAQVTYTQAPQRAVTLNQAAAEILIHLGVGDRIVGTGYEPDVAAEEVAAEYEAIPKLAEGGDRVSHETLLSVEPDFVYSQFASFLTADTAGEREELHDLGVPTYLTEFDCTYHEAVDDASFEMLFEEYERLADVFDVPGAGEALVAEQRGVLEDALATGADEIDGTPTVMWFYSTYAGTPWAAGPGGIPQEITDLVGLENIFDDATTKWAEVSWDEVAARDPDVILLADVHRGEPNDTAAEKIELLKSDPLTKELDAVVNDRFVVIPGRYMDPTYGSVHAVSALVDGLVDLQ